MARGSQCPRLSPLSVHRLVSNPALTRDDSWKRRERICPGAAAIQDVPIRRRDCALLSSSDDGPDDSIPQANIIGSTLGIFLARSLTLSHRRHVALQRLYQPLDLTALDDSDDGESEPGEAPPPNGEIGEGVGRAEAALTATRSGKKVRIEENPWDDGEGEIFGLGDSDDEEAHAQNSKRTI